MITIDLIGPYLAHAPELQTLDGVQVLTLDLLHTIDKIDAMHPGAKQTFWQESTLRLLVFEDLCTPLEDGTVPAVEVAKLAQGSFAAGEYEWANAYATPTNIEGTRTIDVYIKDPERGGYDWCVGNIDCGWNVEIDASPATNQVAIIDYLRRLHFALPVNGKPLVEGQDFIRKTTAN